MATRPWLLAVLLLGAVAAVAVLALAQPWLLLVDDVVAEELPAVTDDVTASEPAAPDAEGTPEDVATPAAAPTPTAAPTSAGPVVLARGSFISRDHPTSGQVAVVELEDGSRVLTIEDLQTDNGPDLYVYLDDDPADAAEDDFDDGIDLGRLRGNVGDLVYELPPDLDLTAVASVAIWCDRFSSLFGAADLVAVPGDG